MPRSIVCERCGRSLVVHDDDARDLCCPRCLSPIRDAAVQASPPIRQTPAGRRTPILQPLIRADQQVRRESRIQLIILIVIGLMCVLGILLPLQAGGFAFITLAFFILDVVILIVLIRALYRWSVPRPGGGRREWVAAGGRAVVASVLLPFLCMAVVIVLGTACGILVEVHP
jgi:hypothetical protein